MQTPTAEAMPLTTLPRCSTRRLIMAGLMLLACGLPFVVSNYRIFQLNMVVINTMALLGLNLLTGYNGQISLGHGAFYAVGAYVTAILIDHFNVPYILALPCSGAVCMVIGVLF